MKKKKEVTNVLLIIVIMWMNITSLIYWGMNPGLSKMQVFLNIPKSFILDFEG